MQPSERKYPGPAENQAHRKILELTAVNHPGVMSHICGLFSRRAYPMHAIMCLPVGDGLFSRIWIGIDGNGRLEQIVKQLRKLEDVRAVEYHDAGQQMFVLLEEYFRTK